MERKEEVNRMGRAELIREIHKQDQIIKELQAERAQNSLELKEWARKHADGSDARKHADAQMILKKLLENNRDANGQLTSLALAIRRGELKPSSEDIGISSTKEVSVSCWSSSFTTKRLCTSFERQLRECRTREEGIALLSKTFTTKRKLERLARYLDAGVQKHDTAETLQDKIIETTIGYRLRSAAIRGETFRIQPLPAPGPVLFLKLTPEEMSDMGKIDWYIGLNRKGQWICEACSPRDFEECFPGGEIELVHNEKEGWEVINAREAECKPKND